MMPRALPEWIAKSPDAAIPPRVKLRIFQRFSGVCPACKRNLRPGHWELDHTVALANGGEHRERNLRPLCDTPCHSSKTADDVAAKSQGYERALSHAGIKRKGRGFATNKDQPFKRKITGKVVPR